MQNICNVGIQSSLEHTVAQCHAVMDQVQPGEILVLTMPKPEPVALIGEFLANQALVRQVAGILVDAAVRDTDELQSLGLPIWTRWIRVREATKTHVGTINETVTASGTSIAPADLVLLDADGAISLAAERVPAILEASLARTSSETTLRAQLLAGRLRMASRACEQWLRVADRASSAPTLSKGLANCSMPAVQRPRTVRTPRASARTSSTPPQSA